MHAGPMDTADNQLMVIARDLRAYADAGMDPTLATKLRAAAAEMEQRLQFYAGEPVSA